MGEIEPSKRSFRVVAVLDTCVLFPSMLRNVLLQLAFDGSFVFVWSQTIEDELSGNLLSKQDMGEEQVVSLIGQLNTVFGISKTRLGDVNISGLVLPDEDDVHLVKAAVESGAQFIVTFNLKDFPQKALEPYGVSVLHPDEFLGMLAKRDIRLVHESIKRVSERLNNPPVSGPQIIEKLISTHSLHTFKRQIQANEQ